MGEGKYPSISEDDKNLNQVLSSEGKLSLKVENK